MLFGSPELKPIITVFGEAFQTFLGTNTLALGDINGDGWPDFAVGAEGPEELRVYLGGPGILDSVPDLVLQGGFNAVAADINGDGIKDIISMKRETFTCSAVVYLGRPDLTLRYDVQPSFIFGPHKGTQFGRFIKAGDFNRDGYSDVVISNINGGNYVKPGAISGIMYIFMGSSVIDTIPEYTFTMTEDYFNDIGYGLQVDDINGDGYDDLAVGRNHQQYGPPHNLFDQKLIWFGGPAFSPDENKPDQVLEFIHIFTLMRGYLVDVNNDGFSDLVYPNDGQGNVHFGTPAGLTSSVGRIIRSPNSLAWAGIIQLDHDITGDRIRDYVVEIGLGAQDVLCFYKGSKTGIESVFAYNSPVYAYDHYGDLESHRVCSVGDVNGDGRNDVLACDKISYGDRGFFHILSGIGKPLSLEKTNTIPATLALTSVRPNPSSGPVEMDLNIPASVPVRVTVHDALGREIAVITDAVYRPGIHPLKWNGRDAFGSQVSSGVYLLRAASGGLAVNAQVVLGSK